MLSSKTFINQIQNAAWYVNRVKILCACSGGIDSSVLFHLLQQVPGVELGIVHFDHQLRNSQSLADRKFAESLAKDSQCDFQLVSEDIKSFAFENQLSVEEAGSQRRRLIFSKIKDELGFDVIAVGHHQDDQLETILMNIYLGTGIKGLTGINEENNEFVRPLLSYSRSEIEEYAHQNGLKYRYDTSNADTRYLRNNIRATLIPHLIDDTDSEIKACTEVIRRQSRVLNEMIMKSAEHVDIYEYSMDKTQKISLGLSELPDYFSAIQKVIFDRAFQSISLMSQGLSSAHFRSLKSIIPPEAIGKEIQLPASVTVVRDRHRLVFMKKPRFEWNPVQLCSTEKMTFPFFSIDQCLLPIIPNISDARCFWYLYPLEQYVIRRRTDGDKMTVDSNSRELSVNQILQEAHVAPHAKPYYPVVEFKGSIVWIPGIRTSQMGMLDTSEIKENDVRHCIRVTIQKGTIE